MSLSDKKISVVMIGATGAVGSEVIKYLLQNNTLEKILLLGRRHLENVSVHNVSQHKIDIFEADLYQKHLTGYTTAICTLGVGQPSKISKEQFLKID